MHRLTLTITFCTLGFLLSSSLVPADETLKSTGWARFRGANGAGVIEETPTIPVEFGPDKNALWSREFPAGHSSPCIWGEKMLLTTYNEEPPELAVVCLDRRNGKTLWKRAVPFGQIEKGHPKFSPASATAATDGKRVCVYFGSCGMFGFDLEGNSLWEVRLPTAKLFSGHATSPVIEQGLAILYRVTENDHFLLAVDASTGKEAWRHEFDSRAKLKHSGAATPVIFGEQVIVHTIDGVSSFELKTGKKLWWVNAPTTATASPVLAGNRVLLATWVQSGEPELRPQLPEIAALVAKRDKNGDGKLSKDEVLKIDLALADRPEARHEPLAFAAVPFDRLDRNQNGFLDEKEWAGFAAFMKARQKRIQDHGLLEIRSDGTGNVSETHVKVLEKQAIPEVPTPVACENRVYFIKNGGILTAVDRTRGKKLYRQRIGISGSYFTSPVLVGHHLYVISGEGIITVIDVSGDKPKTLARNDLKEQSFATPAFTGGVLYLRTEHHLYAFKKARAKVD